MSIKILEGPAAEVRPQLAELAAEGWKQAAGFDLFTGRPGKPAEVVALVTGDARKPPQ